MAQLSICSVDKLNTLVPNKAFQQRSVYYRPQRSVSCIPSVPSLCTLLSDNVKSSVPLRTGNFHSDVWNDDAIQSLPTPYHQASSY
ncbi:hypothetical protein SUGI_0417420 [Cryptomeria japonica]|nr:hypothetical protein SUGI_0417420 [Cryptomeria japonica]